jgi:hypothetical protein
MKAGEKSTAARTFYKRVFDVAARATTEEGTSLWLFWFVWFI